MNIDFDKLKACPLFADIKESDLISLLDYPLAIRQHFNKNDFIFVVDDKVTSIGIVLSGGVRVIQEDFWGNRTIFAHIGPTGLFAEAFSCAETENFPVSVIAAIRSEILLIDYQKVISSYPSTGTFHGKLIQNMMRILAQKNIILTQKMEIMTKRTTREKLLFYFSTLALQSKTGQFAIPFSRQELADYLCVDRSAMTRELGKMQNEELLSINKNQIKLLRATDYIK